MKHQPAERRIDLAIFAAMGVILLLNNLPYLWGWWITPEGQIFSGAIHAHADFFSYLAKMREGYEGAWQYTNRYTTEPHQPSLLFMFYLTLGHLARWSGLSLIVAFHLARIGCSILLLFAVHRLLRVLGFRGITRFLAFVFAFLASGVGWILRLPAFDLQPIEYYLTEAYTFASMMNYPHFAISTALIVFCYSELQRVFPEATIASQSPGQQNTNTWKGRKGEGFRWLRSALAAFVLSWVHPRLLLLVISVGGLATLWMSLRNVRAIPRVAPLLAGIAIAGAIPALLIYFSYRGDPVWAQWAATITPTPGPLWLLEGFGFLWPLAIIGAVRGARAKAPWAPLLVSWLVLGVLIPFLPLIAQRRLMQGLNLPFAILAAVAVARMIESAKARWFPEQSRERERETPSSEIPSGVPLRSRLCARPQTRLPRWAPYGLIAGFIAILSLSTFYYLGMSIQQPSRRAYPWYYSVERDAAMEWLRENTPRDSVVLCAYDSGMMIPALGGNRVVLGHWAETIRRAAKEKDVVSFLDPNTSDQERQRIANLHNVQYVLVSLFERAVGSYDPARDPRHWQLAWKMDGLAIFARTAP